MANPVVWFELNGPAPEKAAAFYSELLGWHTQALEGGYTTVDTHAGAGINGGLGASQDGTPKSGIYVLVDDLQKTLDHAEEHGGRTVVPITEMNVVTFAQFADPQGNVIGLLPPPRDPADAAGGPSKGDGVPVDWWEILGPDPKALWSFYNDLFGWEIDESGSTDEFLYGQVRHEDTGGGIGSSPDGQPHVNVYGRVDDIHKYLERAETLGGKTVMPPMDMENVSFGMLADPQGTSLGLWTPKQT
jgi:predicted enzyme related to lactoylglutathione lyase